MSESSQTQAYAEILRKCVGGAQEIGKLVTDAVYAVSKLQEKLGNKADCVFFVDAVGAAYFNSAEILNKKGKVRFAIPFFGDNLRRVIESGTDQGERAANCLTDALLIARRVVAKEEQIAAFNCKPGLPAWFVSERVAPVKYNPSKRILIHPTLFSQLFSIPKSALRVIYGKLCDGPYYRARKARKFSGALLLEPFTPPWLVEGALFVNFVTHEILHNFPFKKLPGRNQTVLRDNNRAVAGILSAWLASEPETGDLLLDAFQAKKFNPEQSIVSASVDLVRRQPWSNSSGMKNDSAFPSNRDSSTFTPAPNLFKKNSESNNVSDARDFVIQSRQDIPEAREKCPFVSLIVHRHSLPTVDDTVRLQSPIEPLRETSACKFSSLSPSSMEVATTEDGKISSGSPEASAVALAKADAKTIDATKNITIEIPASSPACNLGKRATELRPLKFATSNETENLEAEQSTPKTAEIIDIDEISSAEVMKDETVHVINGVKMTQNDLDRITDNDWLSDTTINAFLTMLPSSNFVLDSSFLTYYEGGMGSRLTNFIKRNKDNLLKCSRVMIPLFTSNHWGIAVIDKSDASITLYDSLVKMNYFKASMTYVLKFVNSVAELPDVSTRWPANWHLETEPPFQHQQWNDLDCAIFTCIHAALVAKYGKISEFEEKHPLKWRDIFYRCIMKQATSPIFDSLEFKE